MMILDVVEPDIEAPAHNGEQTEYQEKQTLVDIACCAKSRLTLPPPTDIDDDVPHPDPFEMSQTQEFYNTANIVSGTTVVWQR